MKLYEKIQRERKKLGLSQEKLGEKIGVSRQAITKWENGTAFPEVEKIVALSECFGVSTDYLLKNYIKEPDEAKPPTPKKRPSWRLLVGVPLLAVACLIWLALWILSICFPVYSVTGQGVPLVGFWGFLGYHQILHESYCVAGAGVAGLLLLLADLLLRWRRRGR